MTRERYQQRRRERAHEDLEELRHVGRARRFGTGGGFTRRTARRIRAHMMTLRDMTPQEYTRFATPKPQSEAVRRFLVRAAMVIVGIALLYFVFA